MDENFLKRPSISGDCGNISGFSIAGWCEVAGGNACACVLLIFLDDVADCSAIASGLYSTAVDGSLYLFSAVIY